MVSVNAVPTSAPRMPASSGSRLSPAVRKRQLKDRSTLGLELLQEGDLLVADLAVAFRSLVSHELPGTGLRLIHRLQRDQRLPGRGHIGQLAEFHQPAVNRDQQARHARVEQFLDLRLVSTLLKGIGLGAHAFDARREGVAGEQRKPVGLGPEGCGPLHQRLLDGDNGVGKIVGRSEQRDVVAVCARCCRAAHLTRYDLRRLVLEIEVRFCSEQEVCPDGRADKIRIGEELVAQVFVRRYCSSRRVSCLRAARPLMPGISASSAACVSGK